MLKLSLEAIEVVDAIARHGSFAAAATRLNKVPSTISYAVGKLEEQLGIRQAGAVVLRGMARDRHRRVHRLLERRAREVGSAGRVSEEARLQADRFRC